MLVINSYEFSKYMEKIVPQSIEIKLQEKIVIKDGGKYAPYLSIDNNLLIMEFTIVDKGGYHNSFGRVILSDDKEYIKKLYNDFLRDYP
jgi:hypothetical protein